MTKFSIDKKSVIRVIITIVFVYLLYTNIELTDVLHQLKHVDLFIIWIAFALNYVGSITLQSLITIKSSNTFDIPVWTMDKVNLSMRFYSMIMPMAAVSVLRWRRYNLLGCSKSHSFILMVQNKVLQILFITFFFVLAFILFQNQFLTTFGPAYLPLLVVLILLFLTMLYLLGVITGIYQSHKFFKIAIISITVLPKKVYKKLRKILFKIRSSLAKDHKVNKRTVFVLLALSLASHLAVLLSQYFSAVALEMHISFLQLAFARSFVQLLLMIPLTVAGIGVREVGFISTLAIFGVSIEEAIALSLILLSFQTLFALLGISVETLYIFKQKKII